MFGNYQQHFRDALWSWRRNPATGAELEEFQKCTNLIMQLFPLRTQRYITSVQGHDFVVRLGLPNTLERRCYVAAVIWSKVSLWCKIPQVFAFSTRDLLKIQKVPGLCEVKKKAVQGVMRVPCWAIWKSRNSE